jgi:hypothetical protein
MVLSWKMGTGVLCHVMPHHHITLLYKMTLYFTFYVIWQTTSLIAAWNRDDKIVELLQAGADGIPLHSGLHRSIASLGTASRIQAVLTSFLYPQGSSSN